MSKHLCQLYALVALLCLAGPARADSDLAELRKKAEAGDRKAAFELAEELAASKLWLEPPDEAFSWYQEAAEKGHLEAQKTLAGYWRDDAERTDIDKAVHWYQQAAEQGDAEAMFELGDCYASYGDYLALTAANRLQLAMSWYRKASAAGRHDAFRELGDLCRYDGVDMGLEEEAAEKQALEWYRKGCEVGEAGSLDRLGECYFLGEGTAQERQKAAALFQRAAAAEHPRGRFHLAVCLLGGHGIDEAPARAVALLRAGAEAGDGPSALILGRCYELGLGADRNLPAALEWYRRAARRFTWDPLIDEALELLE